jgi:hypothetical protein
MTLSIRITITWSSISWSTSLTFTYMIINNMTIEITFCNAWIRTFRTKIWFFSGMRSSMNLLTYIISIIYTINILLMQKLYEIVYHKTNIEMAFLLKKQIKSNQNNNITCMYSIMCWKIMSIKNKTTSWTFHFWFKWIVISICKSSKHFTRCWRQLIKSICT